MMNPPMDYDTKKIMEEQRKSYLLDLKKQIRETEIRRELEKRKEMEFERRKNEEIKNYQPFGRAGCGAPLRDDKGNIIADLHAVHMTGIIKRKLSYIVDFLPKDSDDCDQTQGTENQKRDKISNQPMINLNKTNKALLEDAMVLNDKVKKERYRQELLEQMKEQKMKKNLETMMKKKQADEDERRIREENQKMVLEYEAELKALEKKRLTKEDQKSLINSKIGSQTKNLNKFPTRKVNPFGDNSESHIEKNDLYNKDSMELSNSIDFIKSNDDAKYAETDWIKQNEEALKSHLIKQANLRPDLDILLDKRTSDASIKPNDAYKEEVSAANFLNKENSWDTEAKNFDAATKNEMPPRFELPNTDEDLYLQNHYEELRFQDDDMSEISNVDSVSLGLDLIEKGKDNLKRFEKLYEDDIPSPTRPFDPISPTVLHPSNYCNQIMTNIPTDNIDDLDEIPLLLPVDHLAIKRTDSDQINSQKETPKCEEEREIYSSYTKFQEQGRIENDEFRDESLCRESSRSQTNLTIMPKKDISGNRVTKTIFVDCIEPKSVSLQSCGNSPVVLHRSEFDVYIDGKSNIHFPDDCSSATDISRTSSMDSLSESSSVDQISNSFNKEIINESNGAFETLFRGRRCPAVQTKFNSNLSTIPENSIQNRPRRVRTNTVTLLENRKVFHT